MKMKTNHSENARETSAPSSHELAARLHIDASRHYLAGKDYSHAAHQALVAHGHALLALAQGKAVSDRYRERASGEMATVKEPFLHFDPVSLGSSGIVQSSLHVVEHHDAAAELHEHAARYLRQAAKHYEDGKVALAAHEAQAAHAIALCAIDHSNEAAKHHAIRCCLVEAAAKRAISVAA
jgi:hypothetical protein